MKNYIFFFVIIIFLIPVVQGCINVETSHYPDEILNATDTKVGTTENSENADAAVRTSAVIPNRQDGEYIDTDDMTSEPLISPNGNLVIYLSPYEWEVLSDIHIYNIETGKNEIVLDQQKIKENMNVEVQTTPKKLVWLDDRYVIVIMHHAYGTVTKGGNLFVFDIETKELQPLTKLSFREQISDIRINKGLLYMDIVLFDDDNMASYGVIKRLASINMVYEAIRYKKLLNVFSFFNSDSAYEDHRRYLENYSLDSSKPFIKLSDDLNGDGFNDEIKYQTKEYSDIFILNINGKEVVEYGNNLDKNVFVVDLDKNDGMKEIAVQEFGQGIHNPGVRSTMFERLAPIIRLVPQSSMAFMGASPPARHKVSSATRFECPPVPIIFTNSSRCIALAIHPATLVIFGKPSSILLNNSNISSLYFFVSIPIIESSSITIP